jgi:hypothetical protein
MLIICHQSSNFLEVLPEFRNLTDQTICVQSKVPAETTNPVPEEIDCKSAMDMKEFLVPIEKGYPFSSLRINVGGWRKGKMEL